MFLCLSVLVEARRRSVSWSWGSRWMRAARCGCWELSSWPLQEPQALLTTEPFLRCLMVFPTLVGKRTVISLDANVLFDVSFFLTHILFMVACPASSWTRILLRTKALCYPQLLAQSLRIGNSRSAFAEWIRARYFPSASWMKGSTRGRFRLHLSISHWRSGQFKGNRMFQKVWGLPCSALTHFPISVIWR